MTGRTELVNMLVPGDEDGGKGDDDNELPEKHECFCFCVNHILSCQQARKTY